VQIRSLEVGVTPSQQKSFFELAITAQAKCDGQLTAAARPQDMAAMGWLTGIPKDI